MSYTNAPSHMLELKNMFQQLWQDKWLIIGSALCIGVLAGVLTLTLPNQYRSQALLSPAESFATDLPQAGGLSSLASIAGLRLGQSNSQVELALEYLRSRIFLAQFLEKYPSAQVELMAVESWDKNNDTLLYDEDVYDIDTQQWLREPEPMRPAQPTLSETHEEFLEHLSIEQSRLTSFVRISFTHVSPSVAQRWVTNLVDELNHRLQQKSLHETQQSIRYLEAQLAQTQIEPIRQSLFALIQTQMEKEMLAHTSPEYALQVIDPAYLPLKKDSPRRGLIVFLSMILGGIFSMVFTIIRRHFKTAR